MTAGATRRNRLDPIRLHRVRDGSRERGPTWRVRRRVSRGVAAATLLGALAASFAPLRAAIPVEPLKPVAALAPHVTGMFQEPTGFEQLPTGQFLVFDRRGHAVFGVDRARTTATQIVRVGVEKGNIIQPVAFGAASDGSFVVADAPFGRERVQLFAVDGTRLRGFALPGRVEPRVQLGGMVLNGVGSLQYDGESIYVNEPDRGALITEYSLEGRAVRTIGRLRATGYESDPDLHAAFNTGLPLVHPDGGFYFVFQTGEPRFRRYDATGTLMYERVMQGVELDPLLATQPTRWPSRDRAGREVAVVPPLVRTAAIDREGGLWVAFTVPYTYVFDRDGDKVRVVQFVATGVVTPTSLDFAPDGRLLVTPGCYIFDPRRK
jgi:hypothetical protein